MTRRYWYVAAVVIAAGASLIAGRYSRDGSLGANDSGVQGAAGAYARSEGNARFHLPSSADKVSMVARIASNAAPSREPAIMVRLNIKKGWHVNANPASLRFLIPTTVKSEINHKAVRLDISYPPGRDSHVKLDGKSILVYDDNTILRADMPASTLAQLRSAGSLSLVVTVQSCSNKGICLPPAQLRSTIAAHF
ncbi:MULTISPECIES: protein-disulfide reductase DsbD domain-containing protein [unclassified Acidiphilium]|uniref:protein-disulfide reductase DsbD domain-containing protein n=2 Tax=Acidiphilium TaxID=522 RepID=UPI000BDA613C|nr:MULTISPECIES: protein-disulfide reductase DsbD domain-containing protein [unclassified Acidiphilium]OZB27478.1 MAG: hypothetical protein B7X49_10835 [Acidiphilium sp. 34-64-41]